MPAPQPGRIPASTYRLQFSSEFRLEDAWHLIPYLCRLGVTELYSSPLLSARPGSTHGYDITDHGRLNPELGGELAFLALSEQLAAHDMGLIVDFVPNHMGVDPATNPWWRDVLEHGPAAESSRFFDIDWYPIVPQLHGRILLPILGGPYGEELENGRLQIRFDGESFALEYYDHNLPLNPRPLRSLLEYDLDRLEFDLGGNDGDLLELRSILFHLEHIPVYTETAREKVKLRHRETQVAKRRLAELSARCPRILEHIHNNVRVFNGTPGDPGSFLLLHQLLEGQPYRLAHWRTAADEINYRRFFDINDLAGLRMEDDEVFRGTHELLLRLVREERVTGLRLDHVDGLFDPADYFRRLLNACGDGSVPYLLCEKILSQNEPLRPDWQLHGTTGYEFLNELNGIFVDGGNAEPFSRLYVLFLGRRERFEDVVYDAKKIIISESMAAELNVLAHALDRISEEDWRSRDFTLESLRRALREVVACFPVYRTYIDQHGYTDFDAQTIDAAVSRALRRNPAMESTIFSFIRASLLPHTERAPSAGHYDRCLQFARRFQQYTGPVQAKGLEDTAFYRYGPLLSLNEVGGEPHRFGQTAEEFHAANRLRLERWPLSMLTTSTHDTKRGEDGRARLNALSEMPDEFREELVHWARANSGHRTITHDEPAPDRQDEYMFYQTLIASWPPDAGATPPAAYVQRVRGYMGKAVKEAKVHTSWIHPAESYDRAVSQFVDETLTLADTLPFRERLLAFAGKIFHWGMVNSLAQVVLKNCSPGVPDTYQGSEMWNFDLVDPDNRRPVDFALRSVLLESLEPLLSGTLPEEAAATELRVLLENWTDGRIKLYTTAAMLRLRRRWSALFSEGEYIPLYCSGESREHVVAFARSRRGSMVVVAAPRLPARLSARSGVMLPLGEDVWTDTVLGLTPEAPDVWRNLLSGEQLDPNGGGLPVRSVLRRFPVAVLVPAGHEDAARRG